PYALPALLSRAGGHVLDLRRSRPSTARPAEHGPGAVRTAVLAPRVLRPSLGDELPLSPSFAQRRGQSTRNNSGAILCPGGELADEGLGFGSACHRDWMGI